MSKTIKLAAPPQYESIVDGPGFRIVLWAQGCKLNCPGCHNPETHSLCGGKEYYIEDIKIALEANCKRHRGLTLSGGDPFLQPREFVEIVKFAKTELGLDIWAYCGLTYEQIIQNPEKLELLKLCDVLVDGPFIFTLKDLTLKYRGSSNQRIIDVQQTLTQNKIVLKEC